MSGSYSCGTDAAKASIWSQSSGGKVGRLYLGFAYACAADIPTRRRRIKRVNVEEDEFRPAFTAHSVCRISTIFQAPLVSTRNELLASDSGAVTEIMIMTAVPVRSHMIVCLFGSERSSVLH